MRIFGSLLVLFIALKLTGVIDWSWWWVLSPVWITVSLLVLMLVVGVIYAHVSARRSRKRIGDKMYEDFMAKLEESWRKKGK